MQKAAGIRFLRLNGCTGCHKFVYLPDDRRTHCPCVKADGNVCGSPRFDAQGKALERVLYLPLKERLRKLLRNDKYRKMCQHEFVRPHNDDLMCDVYDAPAWQELMGQITYPNPRIGFQYCIDAFPASAEGNKSMKPGGFMNLSLPPTERGKPANMLMVIVMPTSIKDLGQKKYYDFMADYELRDLFNEGTRTCYFLCLY